MRRHTKVRATPGDDGILAGIFAGKYQPIARIGEPSMMGDVLKAKHLSLPGKMVAIKVLQSELAGEPRFRSKFYGEIEKLSKVSHENVIKILDAGEKDGRPYFVMDFVEGAGNLDSYIALRLSIFARTADRAPKVARDQFRRELLTVLEGTFSGIAHLHENKIVHMDIKPQNILVDSEGRAIVTDLGFAIDRTQVPGHERYSGVKATYEYMHPEFREQYIEKLLKGKGDFILIPRDRAQKKYDLYSLGRTIWKLLSSRFGDKYERKPVLEKALGQTDFAALEMIIGRLVDLAERRYPSCTSALEDLKALNPSYSPVSTIPELAPSYIGGSIRLPELQTVPFSSRVMSLVDTPEFQHLRRIKQLGLVDRVYPGATHTRFEHVLGTYGYAVRYLHALIQDPIFRTATDEEDLRTLLVGALLHDIGHYPFSHALEELGDADNLPTHEQEGRKIISSDRISLILQAEWRVPPDRVIRVMWGTQKELMIGSPVDNLLHSVLDSDIDVDKMDYLQRDSIHAGVSYGRHFDEGRFLNSLTVSNDGQEIAITPKGRTPLEIFVTGRYWMFTEVYWHHSVRAITRMLQRAIYQFLHLEEPTREHRKKVQEFDTIRGSSGDEGVLQFLLSNGVAVSRDLLERLLRPEGRRHHRRFLTVSGGSETKPTGSAGEKLYNDLSRSFASRPADLWSFEDHLCKALFRRARIAGKWQPGSVLLDIPPKGKDALRGVKIVPELPRRGPFLGWLPGFKELSEKASADTAFLQGVFTDFPQQAKKIRIFIACELREILDRVFGKEEDRVAAVVDALATWRH